MNQLTLSWTMLTGVEGTDESPDSPPARAVSQLLNTGKPFERLSLTFFQARDHVPRWFGAFVLSAGGRIVFFPGYSDMPRGINAMHQGAPVWSSGFVTDHVSLEKDLQSWHVTSPGSEGHHGSMKTLKVNDNAYLWFGMSVSDAAVLRPLHQRTVAKAEVPHQDARRRSEVLATGMKGQNFVQLLLPENVPGLDQPSFLHFLFFVGPTGFPDIRHINRDVILADPHLSQGAEPLQAQTPARISRIALSASMDLQVTACELPGKLNIPISLVSPAGRGR